MSTPEPPPGPFYACQRAYECAPNYENGKFWVPGGLRYIKGQWQCFDCFYGNYADGTTQPEAAWDDAVTLADCLELMPSEPRSNPYPPRPAPHPDTLFGKTCPDGGVCHHDCGPYRLYAMPCWRMKFCGSLTDYDASGRWPLGGAARLVDEANRVALVEAKS